MTDSHRTDLVYGHLGEPRYVSEVKKWEFSRVPDHRQQLKQTSSPKIVLSGTSKHQDPQEVHLAKSRNHEIKLLEAFDPFLSLAVPHLAPLGQVSEHIGRAAAAYDPLVGDLLAFGKAKFEEPHPGTKSLDILATVTGLRGENLLLVRLTKKGVRSSTSKRLIFDAARFEDGDSAVWIGPGSPIQQICFSVSSRRSGSLLAVRTLIGIVILRPIIRHNVVPAPSFHRLSQQSRSHAASRLDPNPVVTIFLKDVAGFPFLDVAFNPWFDEQFGIVDQQGQWSVFEIDRGQNVKRVSSPEVTYPHRKKDQRAFEGDWGKFLWVADVNTVVFAQSNSLNVFDIKSRISVKAPIPQKSTVTDGFLDAIRDPRNYSILYVLTPTKVLLIEVQAASDDSNEHQTSIRILLSFWHYRSFHDPTLRLSVTEDDDFTLLLIWSQVVIVVTVFTLGTSANGDAQQLCLDARGLFPNLCHGADGRKDDLRSPRLRALRLRKAGLVSNPRAQSSSPQSTAEVFQLLLLDSALNVLDGFYQTVSRQRPAIKLVDGVPLGRPKANLKSSTRVQDPFIVPDGLYSEDEDSPDDNAQFPWEAVSAEKSKPTPSEDPSEDGMEDSSKDDTEELVKFRERLAKRLNFRSRSLALNRAFESRANLSNHLDTFAVNNDLELGTILLVDAFPDWFTVSDIDSASRLIHDFLRPAASQDLLEDELNHNLESLSLRCETLNIQSFSGITLHHDGQTDDITIVDIYNRLVKYWIAPLPLETPSQTRVLGYKQMRIIALQLYLSIQHIDNAVPVFPVEPGLPRLEKSVELPALGVRSREPITPDPSQAATDLQGAEGESQQDHPRSSILPETLLPTPASSRATSSQRSTSLDSPTPDEAYTRLSTLAHFDFQPALPRAKQRLLSHWEVGTDPSAFDWAAMMEEYEKDDLDADIANDPVALKQKRRRDKRLKRQLGSSQTGMASSSQQQPVTQPTARTPGLEIGSDPVTRPNLGFSSQLAPGPTAFTQEEPGRFGGRPEKKKVVKPVRRQGF